MIANSNAPVAGSKSGSGGFAYSFSSGDWSSSGSEVTITIPASVHGLTGNTVDCQAFSLSNGIYYQNTWAVLETYATISGDNSIVLHYRGTTGYNGRVVLSAYTV